MSGVFQILLTPHPLTARRVCTPPPRMVQGGGHTRWMHGEGFNILEDARHCSVLYIRKYFVLRDIHKKDIERMSSSFVISLLLIGSPRSPHRSKFS